MSDTRRTPPTFTIHFEDGTSKEYNVSSFRGGMLMSPSQCGVWDDMRPGYGKSRRYGKAADTQRRLEKKRDRRIAKKNIEQEL